MNLGGVSRSLFLCLLFGYPKNLLNSIVAASVSNPAKHTQSQGAGEATDSAKETEISKTLVELDVKKKAETDHFFYTNIGGTGTYDAKDNFGFNKVKRGSEIIWHTTDPTQYATKVVSDGLSWNSRIKNVNIYVPGKATIELTKAGGKWKPKSGAEPTTVNENSSKKLAGTTPGTKECNEDSGTKEDGTGPKNSKESTGPSSQTPNLGSQPGKNGNGLDRGALAGNTHGSKHKELEGGTNEGKTAPDGLSQQANQAAGSGGSQSGKLAAPPTGTEGGAQTAQRSGSSASSGGNSSSSAKGANLHGASGSQGSTASNPESRQQEGRSNAQEISNGSGNGKDPSYLRYTLDDNANCVGVKYDGKDVWTHDPGKSFPKSVVFSVSGNSVVVNFKESIKVLRFDGAEWKSVYSGKGEGKSVNVHSKKEENDHKCEASNKVHTYTPKGEVLFNKVTSKVSDGAEEVIFEAKDVLDFATKVVYNETDANNLVVQVFHVNGLTRKFTKASSGSWKRSEVVGSETELTADKVKILTEGKGAAKLTETNESQPEERSAQQAESTDLQATSVESPESEDGSPPPPVTYIDIDLAKAESGDNYEYKKKKDVDVEFYTAKPGFAIKKYTDGANVSWESKGTHYVKEVVRTKLSDGKYKYENFRYNYKEPSKGSLSVADGIDDKSDPTRHETDKHPQPLDKSFHSQKIRIVTQGDDETLLDVNDTSKYEVLQKGKEYFYDIKDGVKCVKLVVDGGIAWEYGDKKVQEYPKKFRIDKMESLIVIFDKADTITRMKSCMTGEWFR